MKKQYFLKVSVFLGLSSVLFNTPVQSAEIKNRGTIQLNAKMHTAVINNAAVSADGHYLATVSDDKTAKVWRTENLNLLHTLRVPVGMTFDSGSDELLAVAFDAKSRWLAIAGTVKSTLKLGKQDKNWIYFFHAETGELVHTIELSDTVDKICTSPDGSRLVALLRTGGIKQWRVDNWQLIAEDSHYKKFANGCAYTNNNKLLTTDPYGYIRLYNDKGKLEKKLPTPKFVPLSVAVSPSSKHFVFTKVNKKQVGISMGTLSPFKIDKNSITQRKKGNKFFNQFIGWSGSGKKIYVGGEYVSYQAPLAYFSYPSLTKHTIVEKLFDYPVKAIFPLANERLIVVTKKSIAAVNSDGKIEVIHKAPNVDYHSVPEQFQISPDGRRVYLGYADRRRNLVFDLQKNSLTVVKTLARDFRYSTLEHVNISQSKNGKQIRLNGKKMYQFITGRAEAMAVSPDKTKIVIGGRYKLLRFDADGKKLGVTKVNSPISNINITSNGLVVALHHDGTVRWYTLQTGELLLTLFVDKSVLEWIIWSPEGHYDASKNGATLIGWQTNKKMNEIPIFKTAIDFENDLYRPTIIDKILKIGITSE